MLCEVLLDESNTDRKFTKLYMFYRTLLDTSVGNRLNCNESAHTTVNFSKNCKHSAPEPQFESVTVDKFAPVHNNQMLYIYDIGQFRILFEIIFITIY